MNNFIHTISGFTRLSDESMQALQGALKRHEFPKGHVLLSPDTICHHFYFIEKGLTRTFYIKDGKDITDWISPENTFAVSLISFINRQPDRRTIELLEPSVLYALSYQEIENLCKIHHDIEHLTRQLVSFGFVQLQQKFDDLHFSTAKERYQHFIKTNPGLMQRVPLCMIATFLGMTQETLSRMRKEP